MSDAIDIAIIDRVVKKMNLPDDRPVIDLKVMQKRIDNVFLTIKSDVPSDFCKRVFEMYFKRFQATENECLKAWALYCDYKSMASLYGIGDGEEDNDKVWGTGGLALIN